MLEQQRKNVEKLEQNKAHARGMCNAMHKAYTRAYTRNHKICTQYTKGQQRWALKETTLCGRDGKVRNCVHNLHLHAFPRCPVGGKIHEEGVCFT